VAAALAGLTADRRPSGVKKLSPEENLYRIRVGDDRIIYQIRDKDLIVLVVKIGHRRDVYR
jgi:mRNA interferase RelE/StbE